MSYIESGIPRKVVIAHESPDAHIGAKVGGAAAVALNQSREMHRMGRRVRLIGPKNGGKGALDIPHELFEMPEARNNDDLLDVFRSDKWMTFWEKALKPDEGQECDIYGHYYVTGGIINELNGSIRGIKIYMGHSWDRVVQRMDPDRVLTPKRALAEASILNNADAIMVSTEAEQRMLGQDYQDVVFGGEKGILDKVYVVPLGLDKGAFSPENLARKRQEWRERLIPSFLKNTLNFYMVGRIAPQKNQLMAVEAFAEALKEDPHLNISLSVFGGPLENNRYYDLVREFLTTQPEAIQRRVKFHGVKDADIAHAVGDVFLGPSIWETFFLAAAEAMASGKPTIISNKPILKEVVGEGSLFVDETDVADIASKIHIMETDREFRQHSSNYNFHRALERYTWEKSARRLDEVWQKLRQ